MIAGYRIHGHAIVSDDHRIAAPDGTTPPELMNPTDWRRFQAALEVAAVIVLGRRGHEANPNVKGRNRLVLSASARGVERRAHAWWWNPAEAPVEQAFAHAAPAGGIAAVPGGRRVFDLFLGISFDEFHLTRAAGVIVPGGIPLFSAADDGLTPEAILAGRGLIAGPRKTLDPQCGVTLVIWRRGSASLDRSTHPSDSRRPLPER
ncbi:MAG: hypothetical protein WD036_01945 [Bauldia sp.]